MEQANIKGIPYGVANFEQVRKENLYYVDKTMYLPQLEETSDYLFLIRPRRFGKSVFVSMMQAYYDIAKADRFNTLFDGLWIQQHPTPLKNAFQIIYLDFSIIGAGMGNLEEKFNEYCCIVMDSFIRTYKDFYREDFYNEVLATSNAGTKMKLVNNEAHKCGYPLFLIIDEYDNFTNVILSEGGKEMFRNLTHASGFYREYFKLFKVMFSRVFLTGVSPVTLDGLSSGYNIDWNISQAPDFNYMLGFSESDVREMFSYYKGVGKLRPDADIEAMLTEMKPWYNNYCFAEECINQERLYNCDMVLYYLRHQILCKCSPKEMVDKNIRTDYKKLKMLADIDRGNQRENRMSVIEEIAATGSIVMNLKTSFPAEYVTDDDNFRSLLYYYGLLTRIATAYKENSSVRDSILGEHNLQGFFKAYLALNGLYLVEPEIELNYGYSDFLMLPDKARYPDIAHSYIMELKYVKPTASDAEIEEKSKEADEQLKKYSQDKIVIRLCKGTQLHLLKLVFRGAELAVCMENNPS